MNDDRVEPVELPCSTTRKPRNRTRWFIALTIGLPFAVFLVNWIVLASRWPGEAYDMCRSQLREIGQAMYIYAQDNGTFSPDFVHLIAAHNVDPRQLVCPAAPSTQCAFKLIPGQSPNDDPKNILVYETASNHPQGHNVLIVDGHVECLSPQRLQQALARTTANLAGRPASRPNP